MFRITNNIKTLSIAVETFTLNSSNLQTVRWARKPLWFPTAKTKLFRVSPRIKIPDDERQELKRLYNNYRTQVKSLRQYLQEQYSVENMEAFDVEQHRKAVEEDFKRCNEINDQWNSEVKVLREERVEKAFKESLDVAKKRLEERLKIYDERLQTAEEIVRKEKEASENFITPEKLDAAIEYAINNPVDYNYALNLDGSKLRGREAKPAEKTETEEKISVKQ